MLHTIMIGSATSFHYVNAPVITMRESPSENSEVVSQSYYSEEVRLLEEEGEWQKIATCVDNYQGWVKTGSLFGRAQPFPATPPEQTAKISRLMAHLYHVQDTVYGPKLTLPFDAQLEIVDPARDMQGRWIEVTTVDGRKGFIQRGDISIDHSQITQDKLPQFSMQFLGLPYTWGGRASFGYDCSGFVQMLYRQVGIALPRDSKDQMRWEGFKEIAIDELNPGDLLFFGLDAAKIRHVGMFIGNGQFIHATVRENTPYVRISNVNDPEWSGQGAYPYRTARAIK